MHFIRWVMVFVWILFSLYFGVGGWVKIDIEQTIENIKSPNGDEISVLYKGVPFKSIEELNKLLNEERIYRFFPWIFDFPSIVVQVITALAFGALGGTILIIKLYVKDKKELEKINVFVTPLFSSLIGFILLGISYFLPSAIASNEVTLRPSAIFLVCLFGGMFSEKMYKWFETLAKNNIS